MWPSVIGPGRIARGRQSGSGGPWKSCRAVSDYFTYVLWICCVFLVLTLVLMLGLDGSFDCKTRRIISRRWHGLSPSFIRPGRIARGRQSGSGGPWNLFCVRRVVPCQVISYCRFVFMQDDLSSQSMRQDQGAVARLSGDELLPVGQPFFCV